MSELAVWNCAQLVTLAGPPRPRVGAEMRELAIVPDGAMLIRDGRIQAIGSRAGMERVVSSEADIVDDSAALMRNQPLEERRVRDVPA